MNFDDGRRGQHLHVSTVAGECEEEDIARRRVL